MKIKVRGNEGLPDGKVVGSYIFTHKEKCDQHNRENIPTEGILGV